MEKESISSLGTRKRQESAAATIKDLIMRLLSGRRLSDTAHCAKRYRLFAIYAYAFFDAHCATILRLIAGILAEITVIRATSHH